jgi:hypothetical protein
MPELFELVDVKRFSPGASTFADAGLRYIHLPDLSLPANCTLVKDHALLCMDQRDGYPTRLFFAHQVGTSVRALNWNMTPTVAGVVWQAFSWKDVPSTTPIEVLLGHLVAFIP